MTENLPEELCFLSQRYLGLLLTARSAHGYFTANKRWFKHTNTNLLRDCGKENTLEHSFFRNRQLVLRKSRLRPSRDSESDIKWNFGTASGA